MFWAHLIGFKNLIIKLGGAPYKIVLKSPDCVRKQGLIWFKNGAYTIVREYFEANLCTPQDL